MAEKNYNENEYARYLMMSLYENRSNYDFIERVKEILNEEYVNFLVQYDLTDYQTNLYNNDLNLYFANENCVPSLVQLTRDCIRKYISDNQVKDFAVPHQIKDILTLRRPIYKF